MAKLRNIRDLTLWPENYNSGDVGKIMYSIVRFGVGNALRTWGEIVIAGNHTLKALWQLQEAGPEICKYIGLPDAAWPPANVVIGEKGEWLVDTVPMDHLSYPEAEAFAVADNEIARQSARDNGALAKLLQRLATEDNTAFRATGMDEDDIAFLLSNYKPPTDQEWGDAFDKSGAGADKSPYTQMTFTLPNDKAEWVKEVIARVLTGISSDAATEGNKNAAALIYLCNWWVETGEGAPEHASE
jgi:hypothetical protein